MGLINSKLPKDLQLELNNAKKTVSNEELGCIIGAFTADSCGSYNEFARIIRDEKFMNACMKMNGGGPFNLFPGQVTDDSELATCMMIGLIDNKEDV